MKCGLGPYYIRVVVIVGLTGPPAPETLHQRGKVLTCSVVFVTLTSFRLGRNGCHRGWDLRDAA